MHVFLSLMISMNSFNLIPFFRLSEMYDISYPVALVRIDSVWQDTEKVNFQTQKGKWSWYKIQRFHGLATILALYVKDDSVPIPKSPIRLAYYGSSKVYENRECEEICDGHFPLIEDQVFLAPICENEEFKKEKEKIFVPVCTWYYQVYHDSIHLFPEGITLPLSGMLDTLSALFKRVY